MKKIVIGILILLLIIIVYLLGNYNKPEQFEKEEYYEEIKQYEKFKEQGTIANVNYKIHNNFENYNNYYSIKGYYTNTLNGTNDKIYYIISMGEQRTGGYSIFITDLKIDEDGNVEVTVHETSPGFGDITTMALSYPTCCLELSHIPKKITIKNTDGDILKKIN